VHECAWTTISACLKPVEKAGTLMQMPQDGFNVDARKACTQSEEDHSLIGSNFAGRLWMCKGYWAGDNVRQAAPAGNIALADRWLDQPRSIRPFGWHNRGWIDHSIQPRKWSIWPSFDLPTFHRRWGWLYGLGMPSALSGKSAIRTLLRH